MDYGADGGVAGGGVIAQSVKCSGLEGRVRGKRAQTEYISG